MSYEGQLKSSWSDIFSGTGTQITIPSNECKQRLFCPVEALIFLYTFFNALVCHFLANHIFLLF